MDQQEVNAKGKTLREGIDTKYKKLVKDNALATSIYGDNDISEVVKEEIPIDSSFDYAEEILRAAGFTVESRPTSTVMGNNEGRFDVVGYIKPYDRKGLGRVSVYVQLRPKAPGDYRSVSGVSASIVVSHP